MHSLQVSKDMIINICGHLGNVLSPYFFLDADSPRYTMVMNLQILSAELTFAWHSEVRRI
jgi:hypothetical protein